MSVNKEELVTENEWSIYHSLAFGALVVLGLLMAVFPDGPLFRYFTLAFAAILFITIVRKVVKKIMGGKNGKKLSAKGTDE